MEARDCLLERITANETHGVIRTPIAIDSQPIDRNNTRVFEPSRDLRLENKPRSAREIVGMAIQDLLERHLAIELGVQCDGHHPQAAPGMRTQQPEALSRRPYRAPVG